MTPSLLQITPEQGTPPTEPLSLVEPLTPEKPLYPASVPQSSVNINPNIPETGESLILASWEVYNLMKYEFNSQPIQASDEILLHIEEWPFNKKLNQNVHFQNFLKKLKNICWKKKVDAI